MERNVYEFGGMTLVLPSLHATHAGIWLARGGEVREASRGEAIARAARTPHVILNAPLVGQRLGYPDLSGLDLLELFAFTHPARFAVPTVAGLSRAVGIHPPASDNLRSSAISTPRRCRSCPFCHLWNAFTIASPSKLCAAVRGSADSAKARSSSGHCGCGKWKPLCNRRWNRFTTRDTTRFHCCRFQLAITRISSRWCGE